MRNKILLASAIFLTNTASAIAGLTASKPNTSWNGVWTDRNGGAMIVHEQNGFLDVSGTDAASQYNSICIVENAEEKIYSCVGDGMQYGSENSRFLYRSTMQLMKDGTVKEEWEGKLVDKDAIKGTATFEKLNERETNQEER